MPENQISARQAVLVYTRRRLKIAAGLVLIVVIYWIAGGYWPTVGEKLFLLAFSTVSVGLCWLASRSRRPIRPAAQLVLQNELAGMMSTTTDQIPDAHVKQYDHWNWRYLTWGLALAAAITLVIDWMKPNIILEIVDLIAFYLAGTFAYMRLTPGNRPFRDSAV